MSESHRVKFRTGRDSADSEAQTSAGVAHYHEDASGYHRPHAWTVDSLHQTMGFLTRGLQTSESNLEIHDLAVDADEVLDVITSYYQNTEVIREDMERLRSVFRKRRSQLLHISTGETRHRLRRLSVRLQEMAARPALPCSAQATERLFAEAPRAYSPAKAIPPTQGANAKPRTPTFGR